MAFTAPTITAISKAMRSAFRAAMPGAEPAVWPNNLYVTSKVVAGAVHGIYLRLEQLSREAHVNTASAEAVTLHARDLGLSAQPATIADGGVVAVTTVGTVIPAGTRLRRADGIIYETFSQVVATDVVTTFELRAVDPGKVANAVAGAVLTPETHITGLGAIVVDDAGLSGGLDTENIASLRERVLQKKRNPAQGGAPAEYVAWVQEALPSANRVFIKRATPGPGQVTVIFMMDDTYEDGVPLAADIGIVSAYLDEVAPSDADIIVLAPEPVPIDITITDLDPDTTQMRNAILGELRAMFQNRSKPGSAAAPFVFSKSWIVEAVAATAGETSHIVSVPVGDTTLTETSDGTPEIAILGSVTFS